MSHAQESSLVIVVTTWICLSVSTWQIAHIYLYILFTVDNVQNNTQLVHSQNVSNLIQKCVVNMHISTYQLRMYIQICYITPHIPNAVNLLCHGLVYSEVNPIVNEWVARIIIPGGFLVGLTSLQATAVKIGDGFCLSLPYDHPARTCFCPTLFEKPYEFDG